MRGAPFGLRPCKGQKLLTIRATFNRHGTTHGSFPTSLIFRKFLFPRGFHLFRGAIRRERPAFYPLFRFSTNLNHFYPVAERGASLSSRNSQHGIWLHQNLHNKKRGSKIPLVKVLAGKGGSCIATARSEALLLFKKPLVGLGKAQGLTQDKLSINEQRLYTSCSASRHQSMLQMRLMRQPRDSRYFLRW